MNHSGPRVDELGPVPAARHDQGRRGHRRVVRPHERKVLDRERGEGVARAGRGDQGTGRDRGVREVLPRCPVGVEHPGAEERADGLGAPGVADGRDPVRVGAVRQAGRLGEDAAQAVQNGVEVGYPDAPDRGEARVVPPDAVAAGVQVGGLYDDEPGGGPPVDEGFVAVHGPRVAVREDDDGEVPAGQRGGDLHLEVHAPTGGGDGDGDRLDRDDRPAGVLSRHGGATLSSGGRAVTLSRNAVPSK
ncbi:hypothetical protein GA0115253_1066523 [Streptomyces sp. Termitarium-T10T-6]|nr:hypothetical protein GA0115253_1066523 [Streptomyces sp. Termitarium-T10T-6]